MSARAAREHSGPPPGSLRWLVLVLISVAMFGNYYVYDSIGPLADSLQKLLGYSDTQIGTLNAIYSFPNIIMVLIGGIIVDRLGTRFSTLLFTAIWVVGAILTAVSPSFMTMAIGRLVFGLGAESMIVAITAAIGQWFGNRELGFAFGLNLSIARAGSYGADMSPTWAQSFYERGWQPPLWVAAAIGLVSLVAALIYYFVDRAAERNYVLGRPAPADRVVWRDLLQFDRSYWYVVGLCVTFYSVIFPFRSTFAIKYFQHAHHLSLQEASTMNSYVFLAAVFATPLFGLMVDRVGHRALFMAGGTFLLLAVFPVLAYTQANLWMSTVMIGVAFSLVPAILWPAVTYLVPGSRLGTAYGLMTMLQNIGLFIFNLAAGWLNDSNQAGADNPRGYLPMLWMFGLLSLFGFVFAAALRRRETGPHGHRLEVAQPQGAD